MKHVVVTGASTGIGRAVTARLIAAGFGVYGSVRTDTDAVRLRNDFGERFTPLVFDVTDGAAIRSAAAEVEAARIKAANGGESGHGLAGLVNNAGIAVSGPLMHLPIEDFRRQLEVNLTGMLAVTQAFLPLLGARTILTDRANRAGLDDHGAEPGRIVNMSSVSGRIAAPFVGAYAASKHGVEALSDSLRRELSVYGIRVVVIQPGRIRTPIWDKIDDMSRYDGTIYAPVLKRMLKRNARRRDRALPPELVAETVHRALTVKKPSVRYALPDERLRGWILPRLLPDAWLDALVERMLFGK